MCYALQYSCLANPMDGGAWWAAVHGVARSRTPLSDFTFTFHFHALEKEMATHSSVLAWRIPGTGEPAGLPSLGLHRVGHDWSDLAVELVGHICAPPFTDENWWSGRQVANPRLQSVGGKAVSQIQALWQFRVFWTSYPGHIWNVAWHWWEASPLTQQ